MRAISMTLAAVAVALAGTANAAILYDANTTTGSVGSFVGNPDSLQVVNFATVQPQVNVNFFTVFGIRYVTVPTVAPQLRLRFYSGVNENPGTGDALATATLLTTSDFALPTTGVTANTSYNFTLGSMALPLNLLLPASGLGVRATFFTDNTFTTVTGTANGPVGRLSSGVPAVGTNSGVTFLDSSPGDGQFMGTEAFVAQSTPTVVGLNIRMAIDATPVPAPAAAAVIGFGGIFAARRRRN